MQALRLSASRTHLGAGRGLSLSAVASQPSGLLRCWLGMDGPAVQRASPVHASSGSAEPLAEQPSTSGRPFSTLVRSSLPLADAQGPAPKRRKVQHGSPSRGLVAMRAGPPANKGQAPGAAKKQAAAAAAAAGKDDKDAMWMIVGLGNPGANYERTRCAVQEGRMPASATHGFGAAGLPCSTCIMTLCVNSTPWS